KAFEHKSDDLIRIQPKAMANHTVTVAQSGSGKSFFLGRIVEELLLKTKSRVLVFDPNADFRKISDVIGPKTGPNTWKDKAKYNTESGLGFLPDDYDREPFKQKWEQVTKVVYSMRPDTKRNGRKLKIDWTRVSIDFLSEDLDATFESELRHCHDFVRAISDLSFITKSAVWRDEHDILDTASDVCKIAKVGDENYIRHLIESRFNAHDIDENLDWETIRDRLFIRRLPTKNNVKDIADELQQKAVLYRGFFSDKTQQFYFSNAYAVRDSKLLWAGKKDLVDLSDARLQVVDLPSITEVRFRLLAVSTFLESEWTKARRKWESALLKEAEKDPRVPTFIIVDEAHNLIPFEPRNHNEMRLREQFRTIAAEGRKFGLFLVLVSQRPDKLDKWVLSECANRAVMKIGSEDVLAETSKALGLGGIAPNILNRCLEFETGRALIIGPWAPEGQPAFLYGAMRRTEEGGRNLWANHWAAPDEKVNIEAGAEGENGVASTPSVGAKNVPAQLHASSDSK
ncbi:MAG: ATP-binding protein, partial [Methylocella sp.]